MTSLFSWQNSISLCPASFRIPRPNLPVTPGVSLEKAMVKLIKNRKGVEFKSVLSSLPQWL